MPESTTQAAPRAAASRARRRRTTVPPLVVGPAPDGGDLSISVECRLDKRALKGEQHDVTIHADWSVTTPHDLDAERVAMAFGAYTSCVPLADVTVPALRGATPALAHHAVTAPRRFGKKMWRLPPAVQVPGCCQNYSFRTLTEAAAHSYQVHHLAKSWKAPVWQLREVVALAAARWEGWNRERALALGADALVREADGVDDLWAVGIAADEIARLAEAATVVDAPLPVRFFIGARYGRADLAWVQTVIEGRPDADFAAWVAGLDGAVSRGDATHWRDWLRYGLPRDDVRFAAEHAGAPDVVAEISAATGWSHAAAARTWLSWAKVGCRPTPSQFAILGARGLADAVPSAAGIDRLMAELGPAPSSHRTELAVMLALLGTVAEVIFECAQGSTTAELVHRRGGRLLTASPTVSEMK